MFISKFDIFNGTRSLYHVDRIIRETGEKVDNGFGEIYVNTKVKDGSDVSELMEVFVNDSVYSDKFPITSDRKRRYKETEEGQFKMCEIIEKLLTETKEESIDLVNKLNSILIDMDRFDDVKRASKDKAYQMQLMIELLPEEI